MPRINLAKLVTLNQGMEGEGELGSGGCGWHAGTKVSSAPAKIPGELRHCLKPCACPSYTLLSLRDMGV